MAIHLPESVVACAQMFAKAALALSIVLAICAPAWPQGDTGAWPDESANPAPAWELWKDWRDPGITFWTEPPAPDYWTLDYRCRTFCNSNTCYEFGEPPEAGVPPAWGDPGWSPLSRLNFSLNSCWHGLQLAHETPTWGVSLEWMMAGKYIQGVLEDYDWTPIEENPDGTYRRNPDGSFIRNPDGDFTDLGTAQEQFTEGQMIDLQYKFQLVQHPVSVPVDVWPIIGFRWQRFDIMAYNAIQVKSANEWLDPPYEMPGDVLTFNQQYYVGYAGAQLRGRIEATKISPPLLWTLQGDWGYTEAYNTDHHLLRVGERYTMERTHGDCWHAAFTVEALLTDRIGFGVQADHLQIRTTGTHRWSNAPYGIDETWGDGVFVASRQTWITAFLRVRM